MIEGKSALEYSNPSAKHHSAISNDNAINAGAPMTRRRSNMNSASAAEMKAAQKSGNV